VRPGGVEHEGVGMGQEALMEELHFEVLLKPLIRSQRVASLYSRSDVRTKRFLGFRGGEF
jgi:hypothetical protein